MNWIKVCTIDDILPQGGRCALVDKQQVAIFRLTQGESEQVFAVSNLDPFSDANVLSRGLVCSIEGVPCVASPIYKQHFSLESGICLEDNSVAITVWEARINGSDIEICATAAVAA